MGWRRWVPGLSAIRQYKIAWLRHDIGAGLALTAVLLPVGIAYAVASGVPAICGLYATIFGVLAYALFGPSRMLVLGPDSSLVALILGIVLPLSAGDSQRAMALAGMLALVSGSLCVLAGTARLGFITEMLSKPIRYGYMIGIALTVLVSQLPALFGFTVKADGLHNEAWGFMAAVLAGRSNGAALVLGIGTLVMIGLLRRSSRVPDVLLAIVAATVSVTVLNVATRIDVAVLGPLPRDLPALVVPSIHTGDVVPVLFGGVAIAWKLLEAAKLTERERTVVILSIGLGKQHEWRTLAEVGRQLGCSREYCSQVVQRALRKAGTLAGLARVA
jgi:MFS superfamily sulfate permease-like transporter